MTIELRFLVASVILGLVHLIAASHLISFVSRLLPLARPLPHGFTGHVGFPVTSIHVVGFQAQS